MRYRALFRVGLLLLTGSLVAGIYHSLRTEGHLPVLSLTEVVERHFNETNDLLQAGEYQKALEQARLAQRLLSRDRHVNLNNIGRAYLGLDQPQLAIESFETSIRLEPEYASAHNHLGIALAVAGDNRLAAASFREALRLDPESQSARENLGRILSKLERDPAAAVASNESPQLERGRRYAQLFHDGELEALRAGFTELFGSRMTATALASLHETVLRDLGAETALIDDRVVRVRDSDLYVRRANYQGQSVPVELLISMTDDGAINGIVLQPASADTAPR